MARNGNGNHGKTRASFRKHETLLQVIRAQCHAQTARKTPGPMLLVDMNAGDGNGVPVPQLDLFLGERSSRSSPEILYTVAQEFSQTSLVLCESNGPRRRQLEEGFPSAKILRDNALAPTIITQYYNYALIVSDPKGQGHNVEAMVAITAQVPRSDFVLTINTVAFARPLGLHPPEPTSHRIVHDAWKSRKNAWMLDPKAWRERLGKRQVAWTRNVIPASAGFRYRIFVVAHALSDVIRRRPDTWEIFP
jgi:hypothetical protein